MSQEDIKQKAVKGIFWSFCERFGSLFILFTANIVLARILTPDDFGLVGILMAFVMISQMLIVEQTATLGAGLCRGHIPGGKIAGGIALTAIKY